MNLKIFLLTALLTFCAGMPFGKSYAVHSARPAWEQLLEPSRGDGITMRILKKKMKRKLRKARAAAAAPVANRNGFWSVMAGLASVLFTALMASTEASIFFILALATVLVGIGLGFRGLSRDPNITLSIVGLVLNGIVLAFYLYVMLLVVALFATCGG